MFTTTVAQLKDELRLYKLKTTGTKVELIDRLLNHIRPKVPRKHPLTGVLETDLHILSMVPSDDFVNLLTVNKYFADIMQHVVRDRFVVEYGVDLDDHLGDVTYYAAYQGVKIHFAFGTYHILRLCIRCGWSPLVIPMIYKLKDNSIPQEDLFGCCLAYAIECEREGIVMDLISAGAPVGWEDGLPFRLAVKVNNDRIMTALIGAGVETITDDSIWHAIMDNNMPYIMFCIQNGSMFTENMLLLMVNYEREDMVRALMQSGALTLRQLRQ